MAFIRPHLEYATAVKFETLTCLRTYKNLNLYVSHVGSVPKNWDDAYCDILHTLNIPPLSERRKLLKMCHLIVHGFVDFPNAPLLYKPCTNYFTRYIHPLTLLQPHTHTNSFYFTFFLHAVAIWNRKFTLLFVVSSPNISMFKKSYNLSLKSGYNNIILLAYAILYIHCTSCIKFRKKYCASQNWRDLLAWEESVEGQVIVFAHTP